MNNNESKSNKKQNQTQGNVSTPEPKAKTIKLGIDVHLDRYVVVRIIDGGTPQPPQRFGPAEFLLWVAKQITLAEKVFTCYEAGPFGYSLHRKLEKMGATNYVVRPRDWDEYERRSRPTNGTPSNWCCTWTATSMATTRVSAWCASRHPSKNRSAASRGSGKVFSASDSAWRHKDAVTPCIMASTFRANGGEKMFGKPRP